MKGGERRRVRAELRAQGHRVLPVVELTIAREEAAAQGVEWVPLKDFGISVDQHTGCPGSVCFLDEENQPVGWCSAPTQHWDALASHVAQELFRPVGA